jgi:phosphoribosylanthranilate isomerase
MAVSVKICGLNTLDSINAAVAGGADFIGIVFYPHSPRYVALNEAARLMRDVPPEITKVGLFVDATDATISETLGAVELDMLQLHGSETPERLTHLQETFGRTTMKAIKIEGAPDVTTAELFDDSADWLLFDAKPPKEMAGALPGGNALAFDWHLLEGRSWKKPWMLSGGLNSENVTDAVSISGTVVVDVSSGVEDSPGLKSSSKIQKFLETTKAL